MDNDGMFQAVLYSITIGPIVFIWGCFLLAWG